MKATKRKISSVIRGVNIEDSTEIIALKELIEMGEIYYPGIGAWWNKVKIGLKDGTRKGLLAFDKGIIVGGSIIKLGQSAKLCALRIIKEKCNKGLGGKLFDASVELIRRYGFNELYFTMPADMPERDYFLTKDGVIKVGEHKADRYRNNGIEELVCDP